MKQIFEQQTIALAQDQISNYRVEKANPDLTVNYVFMALVLITIIYFHRKTRNQKQKMTNLRSFVAFFLAFIASIITVPITILILPNMIEQAMEGSYPSYAPLLTIVVYNFYFFTGLLTGFYMRKWYTSKLYNLFLFTFFAFAIYLFSFDSAFSVQLFFSLAAGVLIGYLIRVLTSKNVSN